MRKKLTALALILVIALTLILSACGDDGLFRKNAERDIKQITAVATYNERLSLIEKSDLISSFNEYLNTIIQYYSYGYITAAQFQSVIDEMDKNFDLANESLGKSALFTLYCIDFMAEYYKDDPIKYASIVAASTQGKTYDLKNINSINIYRADRIMELEAILTTEQINDVRKELNNTFVEQHANLIKEIEQEIALSRPTPDQVIPEGIVSIRVTPPRKLVYEVGEDLNITGLVVEAVYEDESTIIIEKDYSITGFDSEKVADKVEITIEHGDFTDTFEVEIVKARPNRPQREQAGEEDESYPTDGEGKIILIDKFVFSVEQADFDTKEEFNISREAMRRLRTNLEKSYRNYDYYYLKQLESKIVKVTELSLHDTIKVTKADIDAFYDKTVRSELEDYLSKDYGSSTLENAPFNTIVHGVTEDKGFFYVKHILFKFESEHEDAIKRFENEKTFNEKSLQKLRESYANFIGVWLSNPDYDADAICEEEDCPCPYCDNYTGENGYGENHDEACECVACPNNKYINDTPINVLNIINDIEADLAAIRSSAAYADEAERHRALIDKFDEWIYKANEDDGMFNTIEEKGLGYLVPPTGDSGYVKEFERLSRELATQGLGAGGWCVTEFGIHYILVTGYASDAAPTPDGDYIYLPKDYVVNPLSYEVITEGDEYKVYTNLTDYYYVATGTLEQYIYDSVLSTKKANIFAAFQKDFYNQYTDTGIEYFPKTYNNTVKELQASLKGR